MSRILEIYKRNIYGVMGTLIFHILFFLALLVADLHVKMEMKEEEIEIEFAELTPEQVDELKELNNYREELPNQPSNQFESNNQELTNVASNRLAQGTATGEESYQNEIAEAKKLVESVNDNLAKKRIELKDIVMPVETTEGMEPEQIKNVIYSGESNIVYYLENRYHLRLPVPVYLAMGGGKVIVDIIVNQQGRVISAKARSNPDIRDEMVFLYAEYAASNTVFNTDFNAKPQQKGTIHYNFVAQ